MRNWRDEINFLNDTVPSPAKFGASGKNFMSSARKSPTNKRNEDARPDTGITDKSLNESEIGSSVRSNLDEVPKQTKLFCASQADFNMIVQHSEAVLFIRRHLITEAIKCFPAFLTETCYRELQQGIHQKQKALERRFEEHLLQNMGYGTGEAFEDRNMKILHKTCLQAEKKKPKELSINPLKTMHISTKSADVSRFN